MVVGKVVSTVVSTRKLDSLIGSKFLVVESADKMGSHKQIVAVDRAGAGIGDYVLIALGSAARVGLDREAAIDAAVVGIIDDPSSFEGQ